MIWFRGYNNNLKKCVCGTGIDQTEYSTRIFVNKAGVWTYVNPDSVSIEVQLNDAAKTKVFQGDVLKYSFKERNETFNRYYVIKQKNQRLYCEELWRDYDMDCETFEVSRFHNIKYSGETRDIDSFFNSRCVCKVLGNIWENPELIKEV